MSVPCGLVVSDVNLHECNKLIFHCLLVTNYEVDLKERYICPSIEPGFRQ